MSEQILCCADMCPSTFQSLFQALGDDTYIQVNIKSGQKMSDIQLLFHALISKSVNNFM